MTKKVLTILIISLTFILMGMMALYLHYSRPAKPASDLLLFIPESSAAIVRIDKVSGTLNDLFSSDILIQSFQMQELRDSWRAIDSVCSRNYKTADILSGGTAFICIDTSKEFLVLMDIQKRADAHFIDQFLAHNSLQQKISKHDNGLNSFQTYANDTLYYFLNQNVFGISSSAAMAISSLQHSSSKPDSLLNDWQLNSKASVTVYARKDSHLFDRFINKDNKWYSLTDEIATAYWFDIHANPTQCRLEGELVLNSSLTSHQWCMAPQSNAIIYDFNDTFVLASGYFQFYVPDSLDSLVSCQFHYVEFIDSLAQPVNFMISDNPVASYGCKRLRLDTLAQIIPMADPEIKEVIAIDRGAAQRLIPYYPLMADSAKYLIAGIGQYTVASLNMESILYYARHFPFKFLQPRKNLDNVWYSYKEKFVTPGRFVADIQFGEVKNNRMGFVYAISTYNAE